MTVDEQLEIVRRGVVDVIPAVDLRARLAEGRPLRIKLGVDPTAPDIHLGHTVPLTKLRQFQDLGHTAVLIIGDFTARVGDPSGRSATRPTLSPAEIDQNATTYTDQVFKVLDPAATEIRRNSEWFGLMGFADILRLAGKMTVARMLERDDFSNRYRGGTPIGLHEFLYPLMQGYDSVMVRADVELGGTDQMFNLLVGRDLQRDAGMVEQIALLLPLLEGRDGVHKMSKSLGNHIAVNDPAEEMFGKIMSISDALMLRYYQLLSGKPQTEIAEVASGGVHPMQAKTNLARELVSRYWGEAAGAEAAEHFHDRFQARRDNDPVAATTTATGDIWICDLLKEVGLAVSAGEARRLVAQGAVRVDGKKIDLTYRFRIGSDDLLSVGRRRLVRVSSTKPSEP
jgi:tyrosyl-tRNA synthetase